MSTYSLWLDWTTILFVQGYSLTQTEANRYLAWIPNRWERLDKAGLALIWA